MISVVIATYERPVHLSNLLYSLRRQTLACEIIVVDDGSLQSGYGPPDCAPDQYLWHPHVDYQRVACYNQGVKQCSSNHILLMDDDCQPVSDKFLAGHLLALASTMFVRGQFLDQGQIKLPPWFSTTNVSFHRSVLTPEGNIFDPNYNGRYGYEDVDVEHYLRERGITVGIGGEDTAATHNGTSYAGDRSGSAVNEAYYRRKWRL